MNEERRASSFDELARGLASGEVSRRKAFGLLGAALLGGTLASMPGAAWATHRGRSHGPPSGDPTCPYPGQIRVCQCPSGQELCGGACVPSCGSGQQLNPETCQCENSTLTCDTQTCRGCCDPVTDTCVRGTTNEACGTGGVCVQCNTAAGQTCQRFIVPETGETDYMCAINPG